VRLGEKERRVHVRRRIFTVPNQLTFLRLSFLPLLIIFIRYEWYGWAMAVLVAAGASDALDGLLARQLKQRTAIGAYLDPIADKLMLSSSFFVLSLEGRINWWLTILVLGRDLLLLTAAAVILLVVGYRPFPPSIYGKLTTAFQVLLVFLVILLALAQNPWVLLVRQGCGYLVAFFTVFSGLHYSVVVARELSGAAAPKA
jgi:cardiolipin synthase (CMP-forming)